tara:strand:- start:499 stop:693 length:195 start_codon:yes stop_codon:yes gene_type:complete
MNILKTSSIALLAVVAILGYTPLKTNLSYLNCMKATKHSYISEAGASHIAAQCEAFIKKKVMVK